ncbi:MAG: SIMPL domain-containing protein [Pseudomonadota bacterium]
MLNLARIWVCALLLAVPAWAEQPSITVVSTGSVFAVPDMAVVTVGIETEAPTASKAQADNAQAAAETILALRESGIAARDIRTMSLVISPIYADRRNAPDSAPSVRAYRVVNRIQATVRDISAVGQLLDAVIVSGANRIDNLYFAMSTEPVLLDEARRRAVAEATRRAELYAQAMGVILGPVQSLHEGANQGPRGAPMAEMRVSSGAIAPGELEVSATVTITWSVFGQ